MTAPLKPTPDDLARMRGAIDFEERRDSSSLQEGCLVLGVSLIGMAILAAYGVIQFFMWMTAP